MHMGVITMQINIDTFFVRAAHYKCAGYLRRQVKQTMIKRFIILWVVGLLTFVPYGIYYLFFEASRDQYALVSVLVLFWVFGFWGVAGPIISALKIHRVFNVLEKTSSGEELKKLIQSNESQNVVIDLIASENHVPKFIASRIYSLFVKRLSDASKSPNEQGQIG